MGENRYKQFKDKKDEQYMGEKRKVPIKRAVHGRECIAKVAR